MLASESGKVVKTRTYSAYLRVISLTVLPVCSLRVSRRWVLAREQAHSAQLDVELFYLMTASRSATTFLVGVALARSCLSR